MIRKRTIADLFSKTFNTNKPGSNMDCYEQMNTFLLNFSCGRRSLMEFLVKTWALNITMNMRAKLIYFYIGIDGDNGKSTVRKILAALCGDFASSLNKDLLVGRGGEAGKATT